MFKMLKNVEHFLRIGHKSFGKAALLQMPNFGDRRYFPGKEGLQENFSYNHQVKVNYKPYGRHEVKHHNILPYVPKTNKHQRSYKTSKAKITSSIIFALSLVVFLMHIRRNDENDDDKVLPGNALLIGDMDSRNDYLAYLNDAFECFCDGRWKQCLVEIAKAAQFNKQLEQAFNLLERGEAKSAEIILDRLFLSDSDLRHKYILMKTVVSIALKRGFDNAQDFVSFFEEQTRELGGNKDLSSKISHCKDMIKSVYSPGGYYSRLFNFIAQYYFEARYHDIVEKVRGGNEKRAIVRMWFEHPEKTNQLIGHVSLETSENYISFWPGNSQVIIRKKEKELRSQEGRNFYSLIDDICAYGSLPTKQLTLYELDIATINKEFKKFAGSGCDWTLLGSLFGGNKNCAGLTYFLLKEGKARCLENEPKPWSYYLGLGVGLFDPVFGLVTWGIGYFFRTSTIPPFFGRWIDREQKNIAIEHIDNFYKKTLVPAVNDLRNFNSMGEFREKFLNLVRLCNYIYEFNFYSRCPIPEKNIIAENTRLMSNTMGDTDLFLQEILRDENCPKNEQFIQVVKNTLTVLEKYKKYDILDYSFYFDLLDKKLQLLELIEKNSIPRGNQPASCTNSSSFFKAEPPPQAPNKSKDVSDEEVRPDTSRKFVN